MQIYSQLVPLALGNANGSAVAMGFFDGIHIGHRAVIEGAVQWARAHGASPAVFTFKLPTENKMKGKRLLSTEDKHALIERLGVEHYLCPDFEEIKAMTPERIKKSEDFLDKWGHLAIFLGRFFPFIRTFVPFIAGMGGMHWRNFVVFNVLGGITWSTVFTLLGYLFGGIPFVQEHFELLIIGIVAVSIIPTVVGLVKAKLGK